MLSTGSSVSPQYLRLGSLQFTAIVVIVAYTNKKQVTLTAKYQAFFSPTKALGSVVSLLVRRSSATLPRPTYSLIEIQKGTVLDSPLYHVLLPSVGTSP